MTDRQNLSLFRNEKTCFTDFFVRKIVTAATPCHSRVDTTAVEQSLEPLTRDRPKEFVRAKAVAHRFLKGDGPALHAAVRASITTGRVTSALLVVL